MIGAKYVYLWAADSEAELVSEIRNTATSARVTRHPSSLLVVEYGPANAPGQEPLAFARQCLPRAAEVQGSSIRNWAEQIAAAVKSGVPDDQPWSLHVEPHYGETSAHRIGARAWHSLQRSKSSSRPSQIQQKPGHVDATAGRRRCDLIRETALELLQRSRRHLLKQLRASPEPFSPEDSIVQLLLTSPDEGFLSICKAPLPFGMRQMVSPWPGGNVEIAPDLSAPSRAFAKLAEAELRLGSHIQTGETCVDLGAAPGSWTYVAAKRGAKVIAVDRSPLRSDLMDNPFVQFVSHDAFSFRPPQPVDWLLCDVIAEPEKSAKLLLDWVRKGWCRRFVVTLKLKGGPALDTLNTVKAEMPDLASLWMIRKLTANKKEVTVFGIVAQNS